jgi:hypothetical protein
VAVEAIAINYNTASGLWQWSHTATDSTVRTGALEAQSGAYFSACREFPYFPTNKITYGSGPAATHRFTAYTQTYATASRTVPALTSAAVGTTGSTNTIPYGFDSAAQADSIPTAINALRADVTALAQVVNSLIDDGEQL